jgi:putative phosphoribosyl transferase
MTQRALEVTLEREVRELLRRAERHGDGRAPADVHGRTVIVVDDGLATGLTVIAAVRALRARGAERIVVRFRAARASRLRSSARRATRSSAT